jgi:hypothetical protein
VVAIELQKELKMKSFEEYLQNLTPEDFPSEDMQFIAENLGVEASLFLLKNFEGSNLAVPQKLMNKLKMKYIQHTWNGTSFQLRRFSSEFGLSEKTIRKYLDCEDEAGTCQQKILDMLEEGS